MAGVTEELIGRLEALKMVCDKLAFPIALKHDTVSIKEAFGMRLAREVKSPETFPSFSRSLRDGYAVRSADVIGASTSSPVFLRKCGTIPMGRLTDESLPKEGAMQIFTGGILPQNSDAVVMLEDTEESGPWIEIRKSVMPGENVILKGEEVKSGDIVGSPGELLDFRNVPAIAGLGVDRIDTVGLNIGILSTGDEIVDIGAQSVPPGCVRDVNSTMLQLMLKSYGYRSTFLGIVPDDLEMLEMAVKNALPENDVVILSGGSSVSSRDFCLEVMENLDAPGLIVRGVNMRPGKPTLIGGIKEKAKLIISLPGHPLSCAIVARVILVPLLDIMIGGMELYEKNFMPVKMKCLDDFIGTSGIEEYVPVILRTDGVLPVNSKSGYISALRGTAGLGMLPINTETLRKGEEIGVILW
ncbi:MAG TPA: molybdopterin molybdotransferase MoeA [Acetomicrobium flavidum]|uniref:molybdopterin molybdotransferase MoeA n=1 Tax=Acetomicrobium flavidum TaxID=49896 RepID=UPI002D16E2D1|nr:molybdopterin molybdotransferase MoeA [Acetomicrobium flavidum]